jgi:hypothetical protein
MLFPVALTELCRATRSRRECCHLRELPACCARWQHCVTGMYLTSNRCCELHMWLDFSVGLATGSNSSLSLKHPLHLQQLPHALDGPLTCHLPGVFADPPSMLNRAPSRSVASRRHSLLDVAEDVTSALLARGLLRSPAAVAGGAGASASASTGAGEGGGCGADQQGWVVARLLA